MGPVGSGTAVAAVADVIAFDMIVEDAFTGTVAVAVAGAVAGAASSTTSSTASFDSGNPPAGIGGGGSSPPAGKTVFTGNTPAGIGGKAVAR
jgi:hypothetical protein